MNSQTIRLSNQLRTTDNGRGLFARTDDPRNFVMFVPPVFFDGSRLRIAWRDAGMGSNLLDINRIFCY